MQTNILNWLAPPGPDEAPWPNPRIPTPEPWKDPEGEGEDGEGDDHNADKEGEYYDDSDEDHWSEVETVTSPKYTVQELVTIWSAFCTTLSKLHYDPNLLVVPPPSGLQGTELKAINCLQARHSRHYRGRPWLNKFARKVLTHLPYFRDGGKNTIEFRCELLDYASMPRGYCSDLLHDQAQMFRRLAHDVGPKWRQHSRHAWCFPLSRAFTQGD